MLNKFQEVEHVLERASEHLEWLKTHVRHLDPDLSADKTGWVIAEESFDIHVGDIRIRFGECAGSMRNALNYLVCILAEQDSGRVGKHVQFPIERSPNSFTGHRDSYLEGISDEHVALIEGFQPYYTGNWIEELRVFSNWYRHSGLIKIQKTIQRPKVVSSPPRKERIGSFVVEVDSNFFPAVALEDGRPIVETLEKLLLRVRETTDQLKPLLSRYLSQFL